MRYIECPDTSIASIYDRSIFMAGGISNCENWRAELVELLRHTGVTLYNPRRENFDMSDPSAAYEQIKWEYTRMKVSDEILFWFPCETLCPITLYELGRHSYEKKIYVGMHPAYQRRQDVEIQMSLARPSLRIVYNLQDLANQISPP